MYLLIVAAQACLSAQILVVPGSPRYDNFVREFEGFMTGKNDLQCQVQRSAPRLTYTFRFLSSFNMSFPARQFTGKEKAYALAIRVTPEGGRPAHLAYSGQLPELPPTVNSKKVDFQASAGYYLGEGSYRVDVMLVDGTGRACRKSWSERVKQGKVPIEQAAGSVAPLYGEPWKGLSSKGNDRRLTVFLHAAPIYRRRNLSKLSAYDRAALLQSLTGILDRSDFGRVRVVAFDLLGKRAVFKSDNFDPREYRRLYRTLEQLNYGTIDYKVLTQGPTDAQLLTELIRDELGREDKAEAVMFLGAEGYPSRKFPMALEQAAADLPRAVYVAFARLPVPAEDVMYQVVKKSKGKRILLLSPQDMANAIKALAGKS